MRFFKRSELISYILEDIDTEIEVEETMLFDGTCASDHKLKFLLAQREFIANYQEDKICVSVEGYHL